MNKFYNKVNQYRGLTHIELKRKFGVKLHFTKGKLRKTFE